MEANIEPGNQGRHRLRLPPRGRLNGEGGQGLVEFALILPVFLLLLLGLIDFGSAYNIHNDMTHLAGEAARFASVDTCGTGCTSIAAQVQNDADNGCLATGDGCSGGTGTGPDQQLVVCFAYPDNPPGKPTDTPAAGDAVEAIVETNYKWLPFLDLAAVKLRATATMRLEQVPGGSGSDVYTASALNGDGDCPGYKSPS